MNLRLSLSMLLICLPGTLLKLGSRTKSQTMPLGPIFGRAFRQVGSARSLPEVAEALKTAGESIGLTRFFVAELVLGYTRPELVVFIDTMGKAWRQIYAHNGPELDPLLDIMRDEQRPLLWSEIAQRPLNQVQRDYLALYRQIGFIDGVSVPIWGPNGYWAWVGAASADLLTISEQTREDMHMLAMLTLARCRLLRYGVQSPASAGDGVSKREVDVLYWVLEGKTDDEIATILALSKATVKFHIRKATEKLGSSNRITAALKALKSGLLLGPITRHAVLSPPPKA